MTQPRGLLALCALLGLIGAAPVGAAELVIHAGALLHGSGGPPRSRVSIVARGEGIVAVEPGFIDCHVHSGAKLPSCRNATKDAVTHSDLDRKFDNAVFVRARLRQGFTSVRDVGGGDGTVAVRREMKSATRDAADLLGAADRVGSVAAGRYADVVAVAGDPLKDLAVLGPVAFVMKGGIVYRQGGAPTLPAQ